MTGKRGTGIHGYAAPQRLQFNAWTVRISGQIVAATSHQFVSEYEGLSATGHPTHAGP
jgi:hypothetical protein